MFNGVRFELTRRCNLKCEFCYESCDRSCDLDEMNTEEVKIVLNKIKQYKVNQLVLTGGEIFLRKDINDIIDYSKQINFHLTLMTNGTLIKEEHINSIKLVDKIFISLDGPQDIHNRLRNNDSCFQNTIKSIELLKKNKIPFCIETVIPPNEYKGLEWIYDFSIKYKPQQVKLAHISLQGRGAKYKKKVNQEYYKFIYKKALELTKKSKYTVKFKSNLYSRDDLNKYFSSFYEHVAPWVLPNGIMTYFIGENYKKYELCNLLIDRELNPEKILEAKIIIEKAYDNSKKHEFFSIQDSINYITD